MIRCCFDFLSDPAAVTLRCQDARDGLLDDLRREAAQDLAFARFGCLRSRAILARYKYTTRSSALAHPSTENHDTVEAHYASLERPHACYDGWVTLGQIVVDPETGEESEEFALYLCRECAERS
jgi:hypothetical protein